MPHVLLSFYFSIIIALLYSSLAFPSQRGWGKGVYVLASKMAPVTVVSWYSYSCVISSHNHRDGLCDQKNTVKLIV